MPNVTAIPIRRGRDFPAAPSHLSPKSSQDWDRIVAEYVLDGHHLGLLQRALECWDLSEQARATLARDGSTIEDRFGQTKTHPAQQIWKENVNLYRVLLRELQLDRAPDDPRPPRMY